VAVEHALRVPREAWLRLAACAGAASLLQMDGTIITVALPSVGHDLDVGSHTLSWALTVYFLAYAGALFPGGHLVDRLGSRQVALAGLGLFAAGATVGALSPSFELVVASRALQGLGAGLVSPASLAGAVSGFPAERRGTALGIWGASSGMANLIGPLLGGVLTAAFSWRANWWALVPLSLVAAVAVVALVPPTVREDESPRLVELRRSLIAAAALVAGLTFAVMIGAFFLAQQYLQEVPGYSAIGAAAALLIVAAAVAVAAPMAGRLSDRHGERLPAFMGFAVAGTALGVLAIPGVPLHGLGAVAPLVVAGLGLGLLFTPASRAALNAVPQARHGRVSATLSAARLAGAAAGAGLSGLALSGGVTTGHVRLGLLGAAAICLAIGLPAAWRLAAPAAEAPPARAPI
jgi:MFS family permease